MKTRRIGLEIGRPIAICMGISLVILSLGGFLVLLALARRIILDS